MIVGVGLDVVSVARIERAMRHPRFLRRILTSSELAMELTAERVAGQWAAKEALAKAVGRPLRWHDVSILRNDLGAPEVVWHRPVLEGIRVWVSLSHEREMAVAMVVLER